MPQRVDFRKKKGGWNAAETRSFSNVITEAYTNNLEVKEKRPLSL